MKTIKVQGVQYPAKQLLALFSDENMKKYHARIERDRVRAVKRRKGQVDLFEGGAV